MMEKTAILSEDNTYRYVLSRIWDDSKPKLLFIMLNPSTADNTTDDPTIRRLITFTKDWGYSGFYVCNLFAYRSTDPKQLRYVDDPVGPENVLYIEDTLSKVDKVVYAWGNNQKEPLWLSDLVSEAYCIELSKKGIPKHPLYLKKSLELKVYK